MALKYTKLQIFIVYKAFTVGIKTKDLPRITRFVCGHNIKVFYKMTACPR